MSKKKKVSAISKLNFDLTEVEALTEAQQKFFNAMESDDVQGADIKVHLHLDKQSCLFDTVR